MPKEVAIEPVTSEKSVVEEGPEWGKKARGYKGIIARQAKEIMRLKGATETYRNQEGSTLEGVENPTGIGKHDFSPAFATCLTCGTENPDFKAKPVRCANEDCHTPLGSERVLSKIDRCPTCGNTEAEVYNVDEKQE